MLWLNTPIMEFFEMRRYLEKYPHTAPPYAERRPRYVAFDKYFASVLAEFQETKETGAGNPPGVN